MKPKGCMSNCSIRLRMNRPATIDGIPVITSTKNVMARERLPRPYSTR